MSSHYQRTQLGPFCLEGLRVSATMWLVLVEAKKKSHAFALGGCNILAETDDFGPRSQKVHKQIRWRFNFSAVLLFASHGAPFGETLHPVRWMEMLRDGYTIRWIWVWGKLILWKINGFPVPAPYIICLWKRFLLTTRNTVQPFVWGTVDCLTNIGFGTG